MLRVLGERARPSLENWFGWITLVIWRREARRLKRWTRKVREDCGDFGYLPHWVSLGGRILSFSRDQNEGWRDSVAEGTCQQD